MYGPPTAQEMVYADMQPGATPATLPITMSISKGPVLLEIDVENTHYIIPLLVDSMLPIVIANHFFILLESPHALFAIGHVKIVVGLLLLIVGLVILEPRKVALLVLKMVLINTSRNGTLPCLLVELPQELRHGQKLRTT